MLPNPQPGTWALSTRHGRRSTRARSTAHGFGEGVREHIVQIQLNIQRAYIYSTLQLTGVQEHIVQLTGLGKYTEGHISVFGEQHSL